MANKALTIDWFLSRIGKTVNVTAPSGETTTGIIRDREDANKMQMSQINAQQLSYSDAPGAEAPAEEAPAAPLAEGWQPIEFFTEKVGRSVTVTTQKGETDTATIRDRDDAKKLFASQGEPQNFRYTEIVTVTPDAPTGKKKKAAEAAKTEE